MLGGFEWFGGYVRGKMMMMFREQRDVLSEIEVGQGGGSDDCGEGRPDWLAGVGAVGRWGCGGRDGWENERGFWFLGEVNVLSEEGARVLRQVVERGPAGGQIVCWSGTMMGEEGGGAISFEGSPLNWTGAGYGRLIEFADGIRGLLEARGIRLFFLPHARHVLSDPTICRTFLDEVCVEGGGALGGTGVFGLVVSPIRLFEVGMMVRDAGDHLRRIFEGLGGLAEAIVAEDGVVDPEGAGIVVGGSGDEDAGIVDWGVFGELVEELVRARAPIVLRGGG